MYLSIIMYLSSQKLRYQTYTQNYSKNNQNKKKNTS